MVGQPREKDKTEKNDQKGQEREKKRPEKKTDRLAIQEKRFQHAYMGHLWQLL